MPTRKCGDGAGSPPIARDNGRETSQSPLRSESASARTDFGWAAANARLHARGRVAGIWPWSARGFARSEEHTSELQSLAYLVCRLLLEKKKKKINQIQMSHLQFLDGDKATVNKRQLLLTHPPARICDVTRRSHITSIRYIPRYITIRRS